MGMCGIAATTGAAGRSGVCVITTGLAWSVPSSTASWSSRWGRRGRCRRRSWIVPSALVSGAAASCGAWCSRWRRSASSISMMPLRRIRGRCRQVYLLYPDRILPAMLLVLLQAVPLTMSLARCRYLRWLRLMLTRLPRTGGIGVSSVPLWRPPRLLLLTETGRVLGRGLKATRIIVGRFRFMSLCGVRPRGPGLGQSVLL